MPMADGPKFVRAAIDLSTNKIPNKMNLWTEPMSVVHEARLTCKTCVLPKNYCIIDNNGAFCSISNYIVVLFLPIYVLCRDVPGVPHVPEQAATFPFTICGLVSVPEKHLRKHIAAAATVRCAYTNRTTHRSVLFAFVGRASASGSVVIIISLKCTRSMCTWRTNITQIHAKNIAGNGRWSA